MPERIDLEQPKARVGHAYCKMREVINDKGKHNKAAHHHMAGSEVCFDVVQVDVAFGPRTPIFDGQLDRHVNMDNYRREQEQTDCPKQRAEIAQMLRVTVNPVWTQENLQIPE